MPPVPFPVGRQKGGPFFPALYPFQCAPRKFFNLEVQNHEEDCEERMDAGGSGARGRANTIYERLFWAAAQEETALWLGTALPPPA